MLQRCSLVRRKSILNCCSSRDDAKYRCELSCHLLRKVQLRTEKTTRCVEKNFPPPMDEILFPGRLRPGKKIASIGRRLYIKKTTFLMHVVR